MTLNHDHEVTHLDEIGRRRLLQLSALALGASTLSTLFPLTKAESATLVKLPGFSGFAKSVKVFKSGKYYMVESSGLPDHSMMVGIKAWQQQVPTVQPYSGANAWGSSTFAGVYHQCLAYHFTFSFSLRNKKAFKVEVICGGNCYSIGWNC